MVWTPSVHPAAAPSVPENVFDCGLATAASWMARMLPGFFFGASPWSSVVPDRP